MFEKSFSDNIFVFQTTLVSLDFYITDESIQQRTRPEKQVSSPLALVEGSSANISCKVHSNVVNANNAIFRWLYSKPNILGETRPELRSLGEILHLHNVTRDDSGYYTCEAVGEDLDIQYPITINVFRKLCVLI